MKKTVKKDVVKTVAYDVAVYMRVSDRGLKMQRVALLIVQNDGLRVAAVSKSMPEAKRNPWQGEQNGWQTTLEDALVFKTSCRDDFSAYITAVRGEREKIALIRSAEFQAVVRKRRLAESI